MKTLVSCFAAVALAVMTVAQSGKWYHEGGPTNVFSWRFTNLTEQVVSSSVLILTTNGLREITTTNMSMIYSNMFAGLPSGIYSVQVSGTLKSGAKLMPSTNAYLYPIPVPPLVMPGAVGLETR